MTEMPYPRDMIEAAHSHSSRHREEIEGSTICGCFHCCQTCLPSEFEWLEELDGTALCPRCGIDSVIGSASGFPVADPAFLKAMHDHWFG